MRTLKAVVVGAGWAGEGHVTALRAAGVDVIALCGRTPEPAKAKAAELGIQDVRFDWHKAIEDLQPDVVSIATPAGPHCEMAEVAAQLGCHIICEKPLAVDAKQARTMLLAVEQANIKHAYGATWRYTPEYAYCQRLLKNGLIGQVREIEYVFHFDYSPMTPYYWFHETKQGGGMLNGMFTHMFAQIVWMTGGRVQAVTGEARPILKQAPVGPTFHDFRDFLSASVDLQEAEITEWRDVDADISFTVGLQLQMPDDYPVSAWVSFTGMAQKRQPNYLAFYGSEGSLYLDGDFWPEHIQYLSGNSSSWEAMSVPDDVIALFPQNEDGMQRGWNQLFREFITDVQGNGYTGYPTFYDGWLATEVMDAVRNSQCWTSLPAHPNHQDKFRTA